MHPSPRWPLFALALAPSLALSLAAPADAATPNAGLGSASSDAWTLAARARSLSGVEQAAPLYALWNQWDSSDPIAIAAAYRALGEDPSIDPAVRPTALAFAAAARLQLGDAAGARSLADGAGYVARWLVVGPFDHEGRSGFAPEIGPELDRLGPLALAGTYDGKDHRAIHWRLSPADASPYAIVDLAAAIRPTTVACAFATTFVAAPEEPAAAKAKTKPKGKPIAASVWVGAGGSVRVYWNGEPVVDDVAERGLTFDREAAGVTIAPGWNRVLVKVCGADRPPAFSLRVADERGAPIHGLRVDPDPRHAGDVELPPAPKPVKLPAKPIPLAAETKVKPAEKGAAKGKPLDEAPPIDAKADAKKAPKKGAKEPPPPLTGPLLLTEPTTVGAPKSLFQRLLARVHGDKPAAADLEALARYMRDTSAGDPTRHESFDVANRAAEAGPTVERLLLAGELAEDRNQRRIFVEKAVALAPKRAETLRAEGELLASGPDPDAALPKLDAALAADPDHLPTITARADLLAAAGLKRTARAEIERALATRPRARALLQRQASLLAVDAPAEADEVRARYEELGMSNGAYLAARLQEAVDTRDPVKAKAVVARWRFLDPTGDVPIKEGGGALEKLGDVDGAAALYAAGLEVSPDDPALTIALGDLEGRRGKRDVQLRLYKQTLARWQQLTALRDYLEQAEPSAPREDEAFAEAPAKFLARRAMPSMGFDSRVLTQIEVTTVAANGLAARFHQIVYQPLTAEAVAKGRRYAFGFQGDIETVTVRAARIFHKDGKIDDATESGESRNDDPSISMYTSSRIYSVAFPNLQIGDVVELQYRIEDTTPRNAFGDYFGEVAYLQNGEPTGHLEYVLRAPKGRKLSIHPAKNPKVAFTDAVVGESRVLHWIANDVPGTISEEKMPPWAEVLDHVSVSTYSDWNALGTWYWNLVKDQFVADDKVRAKVADLTHGLTKPEDKVRAIYDWVVQQTRYVALEFGIHGFLPYRCAQIFARGFGDCKDKATLIVTMLGEAGIDATPVLVRTNLRGDIETDPPSLALFDHMIAYVPSMDLYLDGTAEDHGTTELPAMDRGALAVRIEKGKPVTVHLPDPAASASQRGFVLDATFKADLSADLELTLVATGMFAPRLRARYRTASAAATKLGEDLPGDLSSAEWSAVTPVALDDLEKTPTLEAKGKATNVGRADGDRRSLPITTLGSLVATWAPLSDRKQDTRFWSTQAIDDRYAYHFPASVKVERAPESKKGTSPFGSYTVEVESQKGTLKIRTHLELAVTRVHPKDYAAFRAFLREADQALGQRVIVKG